MNVMDISSLLLIEESADSEGDSDFFTLFPYNITSNSTIGYNEDDAESCTCDSDGRMCNLFKGDEDFENNNKGSCEIFDDDEDGTYGSSDAELEIDEFSSPMVVDEDHEEETRVIKVNVNDVEDKLFWEICMAVGYP